MKSKVFQNAQAELFEFLGWPQKKLIKKKKALDYWVPPLVKLHGVYVIGKHQVELKRKAYQKGISFRVLPNDTLSVTTGLATSLKEIHEALSIHWKWIQKQWGMNKTLRTLFVQKKWTEGESFPFVGESKTLNIQFSKTTRFYFDFLDDELRALVPEKFYNKKNLEKLNSALRQFYKREAISYLSSRVDTWASSMGLFPKSVRFRAQNRRWGSCSSRGDVSLNWKIIVFSSEIIDYVLIHELSHLKHMNHSPVFWKLVESFCPNYKKLKVRLKEQNYDSDFLSKSSEIYMQNPGWKS